MIKTIVLAIIAENKDFGVLSACSNENEIAVTTIKFTAEEWLTDVNTHNQVELIWRCITCGEWHRYKKARLIELN